MQGSSIVQRNWHISWPLLKKALWRKPTEERIAPPLGIKTVLDWQYTRSPLLVIQTDPGVSMVIHIPLSTSTTAKNWGWHRGMTTKEILINEPYTQPMQILQKRVSSNSGSSSGPMFLDMFALCRKGFHARNRKASKTGATGGINKEWDAISAKETRRKSCLSHTSWGQPPWHEKQEGRYSYMTTMEGKENKNGQELDMEMTPK